MKIDLDKLKNIEIDDVAVLTEYFEDNICMRSAFSPVNLFIWGTQFNAQFFFVDDKLVIYNKAWNCILLPCGSKFPPGVLRQISNTFYDAGMCGKVSFLDKAYIEEHQDELVDFDVYVDRNNADYIYYAERLATLRGKKLAKKKNQISQFIRAYPDHIVSDLTSRDLDECFELAEKWVSDHHRQHPGYKYEKNALRLAFDNFGRLKMKGKKIHVGDNMIAFSLCTELNKDTAIVHFEKFDREIKGVSQLINREMAQMIADNYLYINREEDMGIEQLRKAKKSYQPLAILDSYILERKKDNNQEVGA